jgi:hypothetical protein
MCKTPSVTSSSMLRHLQAKITLRLNSSTPCQVPVIAALIVGPSGHEARRGFNAALWQPRGAKPRFIVIWAVLLLR